jgi:hypothetical protein
MAATWANSVAHLLRDQEGRIHSESLDAVVGWHESDINVLALRKVQHCCREDDATDHLQRRRPHT